MNDKHKEIWFGSFYEPAYSDTDYLDRTLSLIKDLGFTTVLLDAKAWEDLRDSYENKGKSQYVASLEHMMAKCVELGLEYSFLALYLSGDNLYPDIRFSPPILGSAVVDENGKEIIWYRYWSEKAKDEMERHVKRLYEKYAKGRSSVLCSMWDPIVAPSFDKDGNDRYVMFLEGKYRDIDSFNKAYGSCFRSFEEIKLRDVWQRGRSYEDNRAWQASELELYFSDMKRRLSFTQADLIPMIAQWGFFLTFDGSKLPGVGLADLWDTANRGVDLYSLKDSLDGVNFIAVPVDPDGSPDCYVNVYSHRFLASLNRKKEFLGGIFLGRFLYGDAYSALTPVEVISSIAASGAKGYRSYGVNGLDDGGLIDRMDKQYLENIARANRLFDEIRSLGRKKENSIAILFPKEMALAESYSEEGNKQRRLDSLGYMHLILDHGLDADVIDPNDISNSYRVIICPANSLYSGKYRDKIVQYVKEGGVLLLSQSNSIGMEFSIETVINKLKVLRTEEDAMLQGPTSSPIGGKVLYFYKDGKPAVSEFSAGKGRVIQFGFDYGYEYVSKSVPHVPRSEHNSAIYPLQMMKRQIISSFIGGSLDCKGLEIAEFEKGYVAINHTSYAKPAEIDGRIYEIMPRDALIIRKC